MVKDSDIIGDRLSAALTYRPASRSTSKSKRKGFTSRSASKARKAWLADQTFVPTSTIRIHEDAITLAKSAWTNRYERVRECSEAVRERARRKLGLS